MMKNILSNLIPKLRQEFVLVIFLLIGYAVSQASFNTLQLAIVFNFLLFLFIVWLIKVFVREDFSRHYKGFIVLISGLAMFTAGLYASLQYYFVIIQNPFSSIGQYFYLFFPLWVMIEGILMLFIMNFDNQTKGVDLESKIEISEPLLGDFITVALATVVLILLGEFVIDFPWYLNVCLVMTVNLIVINQFGGQIEEKKIKKS